MRLAPCLTSLSPTHLFFFLYAMQLYGHSCETGSEYDTNSIPQDTISAEDDIYFYCTHPAPDRIIVGGLLVLILMAGCALLIIVERSVKYFRASRQSRLFLSEASSALYYNNIDKVISLSAEFHESPLALVVKASLESAIDGRQARKYRRSPQSRQKAIFYYTKELRQDLWVLGAISGVAPLVSLFVLSIKIINSYNVFLESGGTGLSSIIRGISEAMLPISLGIAIAIPAVWMYKYLCAKAETLILEMDRISLVIINHLIMRQSEIAANAPANIATQPLSHRNTHRSHTPGGPYSIR